MNIFRVIVSVTLLLIISVTVFADDNGVLVKTRIVMNVPASIKLKVLEEKIKYLVDKRTDKYNEYKGIMPDEISDAPGEAKDTQSAATINFDDAVYAVRAYTRSSFLGNSDNQVYVLTIYPYTSGYRIYLYTYFRSVTNFLGAMFSSTTKLDEGFINTVKARDILLAEIPQITIYRQSPDLLKQYALINGEVINITLAGMLESVPETSIQIESKAEILQNKKVESM